MRIHGALDVLIQDLVADRQPGPPHPPKLSNWELGHTRVTSSTIEVGKLVIGMFDPASKQLVWRGSGPKRFDIKKDPDKNYRNLEKAIAKLFRNYPQGAGKR